MARDDNSRFQHKLVVAVRTDLKISPGKVAVQVGHASVVCALKAQKHAPERFRKWFDEGQRKVVVKAAGLKELMELRAAAQDFKIICEIVADAGLTEVEPGTVTCIGIGPDEARLVDRVTGSLPLM
jgi:PTH2 family peptidyl-tRNA hydrolase